MIDEFEQERLARRNAWLRSVFAAVVVAGAHAGGFAWLSTHDLSTQPPDSVLGVPLELDLLAVAPPEPPHDVAPPAPAAPPPPQTTPDATPTPEPTPPPAPEPPPPTPEVAPTVEPAPTPLPTQEAPPSSPEPSPDVPTPAQTPPSDAVIAPSPPPPPKPRPEPPKPRPSPAPPKPRPSPPPSPKPDPEKIERERAQAEAKDRAREARRQAKIDAANRVSNDTTRSENDGRPGASQRPVSSGANLATWRGEVLARISEFKPSSNGASGTAVVAFTVDGGGRVVSASLVRSSGDSSLDAASVAMVRRASPVPAPPPELGGHVNLTVPVRFQ